MKITQRPSDNQGERRRGETPDLIVLHYTAMHSTDAAQARLCDPEHEVSAHYLISEHGEVVQLVPEHMRAWHAGAGGWGDCSDVNSRSIGIELANNGATPFAAAQMDALEALLPGIMQRWAIVPERIIGHSDMAPLRKSDPGARFDWRRLALLKLSVWPISYTPQVADTEVFTELAQQFGYPPAEDFQTILDAFRLRFRPWADGPLNGGDMAAIADLSHRFPVDQAPASV